MTQKEYLMLRRKAAEQDFVPDEDALKLKHYEEKYIAEYGPNWITTINGAMLSIAKPEPESILLEDIAHGLSMVCRYNGHVRKFYSVAQHSVEVSKLVPSEFAIHGLMHDASEALIGDVISPLKREMGNVYYDIEEKVMDAVSNKFNYKITAESEKAVKIADMLMLRTEMRDLTNYCYKSGKTLDETIIPQPQEIAKEIFLGRYREIVRGTKKK